MAIMSGINSSLLSPDDKSENNELGLEEIGTFIETLGEDKALETFLIGKMQKQSFPLPDNDEVTALVKMQDGFVVGLKSGKLMLISPPISRVVNLFSTPISGIFAASNFFIMAASGHFIQAWGVSTWQLLAEEVFEEREVVCITGNMVKEIIFLGFDNGDVEQLLVDNKEKAIISLKYLMKKIGDPSAVADIKTNNTTLWVAIRHKSNELTLWDHETGHLLYHFSFDGSAGIPSSFTLGESRALPPFFSPAEGWDAFPQLLIFSSLLIIRMSGTAIAKAYSARRLIEADDARWQAYAESLAKGYMPYFCGDYLISFTSPGAEKKKPSEKQIPEIELDLGMFFTFAEKSEANNYIAFAAEKTVEVYCLAAMEANFTHRPAGPTAVSKHGEVVYSRLGSFYNSHLEQVKPASQREFITAISRDGKWLVSVDRKQLSETTANVEHFHRREESKFLDEGRGSFERSGSLIISGDAGSQARGRGSGRGRARGLGAGRFRRGRGPRGDGGQSRKIEGDSTFVLITSLQAPFGHHDLKEWQTRTLKKVKFSRNGYSIGLLFTDGFIIYSFENGCIEREFISDYTKSVQSIKSLTNDLFILTGKGWYQAISVVPSNDGPQVHWDYTRFSLLKTGSQGTINAVAYSMTATSVGDFTEKAFWKLKSIDEGFERVKILNSGKMFVGNNDSGIYVYALAELTRLFKIPLGYSVTVSAEQKIVYALCTNSLSPNFSYMDIWDLEAGIKTQSVYFGLKHVDGNRLIVKGPGMWSEPKYDIISQQNPASTLFKSTWQYDLRNFANTGSMLQHRQLTELSVSEESLEQHCIVWKQLVGLLRKDELKESTLMVVIRPVNINVLHLLAHRNQARLMTEALESGCPVMKSAYGTPLRIAIDRKARKCTNAILNCLINLKELNSSSFLTALFHIQDDLPALLEDRPPILAEFLQNVIVPLPQEMVVQPVIRPADELPVQRLTLNMWVDSSSFASKDETTKEITVEYLVCPFPVYVDLGCIESIAVLNTLVKDKEDISIHRTLFVKTIVDMKWNQLWWFIFVSTVLYWVLLGIMMSIMLHYIDGWYSRCAFIGLNTWFLLIEVLQLVMSPSEYITEYWNYVDMARTALSYIWALTRFEESVTFAVVLLSLLRGITTFQTFSNTRFYVRMVFVVTQETMSFIWLFFYSTMSFGLLFASVNPDPTMDFFRTWTVPYELNMGNFDVSNKGEWYWFVFMAAALVNVIIMLNLVVSILGDAYDKFQTISEAADVMGKAEVLYEYERMMWWKRGPGAMRYLQICRNEGGEEGSEEWAGKVEEIKKEIKKIEKKLSLKIAQGLNRIRDGMIESQSKSKLTAKMDDMRIGIEEKLNTIKDMIKLTGPSHV